MFLQKKDKLHTLCTYTVFHTFYTYVWVFLGVGGIIIQGEQFFLPLLSIIRSSWMYLEERGVVEGLEGGLAAFP